MSTGAPSATTPVGPLLQCSKDSLTIEDFPPPCLLEPDSDLMAQFEERDFFPSLLLF